MKIIKIKKINPIKVYAVTTSTGTFIADGLAHHNCYRCNIPLKGNPRAYDAFMRVRYGVKVIRELERLDRKDKQWKPQELLEIINKYK